MKTQIKQLRDKAEAAVARQNSILEKAQNDNARALTAEEKADFDAAVKDFDDAMAAIVPLQEVAERSARVQNVNIPADPVRRDTTGVLDNVTRAAPAATVPAIPKSPDEWKVKMGCYAWAAAKAKAAPRKTGLEHLADFGLQQLVDEAKAHEDAEIKNIVSMFGNGNANPLVVRALTSLSGGGADNMVTTPLASEFIEFLKVESAFFSGGPVEVPMPLGSLDISAGNAGTAGTYHAQNADLGYTEATTRKVSMSAKHIGAVTAFSNYALEISPLPIAAIFGDELARSIVLGIDAAGLRGDGSGENPSGILSLVNASHKYAAAVATATPTIAQIDTEAKKALGKFDAALIPKRRRKWSMASRTFRYLQFLRTTGGENWAYPGLHLANPVWHDNIPVIISDQHPTNLGSGTNESELMLVDYGHVLMGMTRSLRLKASTEASYKNSGGTLISAFSRDETVVRAMASHDFDMRHTKAAVCVTGLLWGA